MLKLIFRILISRHLYFKYCFLNIDRAYVFHFFLYVNILEDIEIEINLCRYSLKKIEQHKNKNFNIFLSFFSFYIVISYKYLHSIKNKYIYALSRIKTIYFINIDIY